MADQRVDGELVVGMNSQPLEEGMKRAGDATDKQTERMNKAVARYEKALAALEKVQQQVGQATGMQNLAKNTSSALQKAEARVKEYNAQIEKLKQQAATYEQQQAAQLEKLTSATSARTRSEIDVLNRRDQSTVTREAARRNTVRLQGSSVASNIRLRSDKQGELDEERRKHDLLLTFLRDRLQRERSLERESSQERSRLRREELAEAKRVAREQERQVQQFFKQRGGVSAVLFDDINRQLGRRNLQDEMTAGLAQGIRPSEILQQKINAGLARGNAANAADFAAQQAAAAGGRGAGRGGFFGGIGRRLLGAGGGGVAGSLISGAASGFGIGLGGYALAQAGRSVIESTQEATAFDRQRKAAEGLAGSVSELNALLDAYQQAAGGAVDKTTALASTTRLLATGFANSSEEVGQFVRATRGASIALGKPQDEITQETQLAISNTSQRRLDQIGLGIEEVTNKIEELRRTNKDWTRETAFHEAVITLMDEKYGHLTETLEGQATGAEKLAKSWRDLRLEIGQTLQQPVNRMAEAIALMLDVMTAKMRAWVKELDFYVKALRFIGTPLPFLTSDERAFVSGSAGRDQARHGLTGQTSRVAPPRFKPEQWDVISAGFDALEQVQKDANRALLDEQEQYEEQRLNLVSNFAKQMVREEEDFARQRARALRDYERAVLDIMRSAQERESDMQEELDERIAELREDGNERIEEIEEKYRKDREKAEEQHRDRLLKAAGQLDAIAVLEERKRWREENEEAEEGHKEALEKQREALEEQIEDALKAHNKRLEDAREADAKRLEDMRINRAQQIADENEDRAIRKARAIEDHNDQLEELDRQHGLRMQQIQEQAAEETQVLEDALAKDLTAVGVYVEGYLEKIKARDEAIEKWFDTIIQRIEGDIRQENAERDFNTYNPDSAVGPRLSSGAVLHGASASASAAAPAPTSVTYGGTRNFTIQSGAFQVTTTPGLEIETTQLIENTVISLLENY